MVQFLRKLFVMDGTKLINKTIGMFDRVVSQLKRGIEMCNEETAVIDTSLNELTSKKMELADTMVKAKKVLANLEKLLS